MSWDLVPEELLLQIFSLLQYQEVVKAGSVCSKWRKVSKDDILWRKLIRRDFKLKRMVGLGQDCRRQYQRMVDECPVVCHQVLDSHSDEVLFVSFSHSGELFVTCSKDGTFIVWKLLRSGEAIVLHTHDMKRLDNWIYTWAAKFNSSSTLLLVAGVLDEVDGSVAVFKLSEEELTLLRIVRNNPYDVMGAWCDNDTWLCGEFTPSLDPIEDNYWGLDAEIRLFNKHTVDVNDGWRRKADSVLRLRQHLNDGSNYLRCLMVTDTDICHHSVTNTRSGQHNVTSTSSGESQHNIIKREPQFGVSGSSETALSSGTKTLIFLCSGPTVSPHQIGFKHLRPEDLHNVPIISEPDYVIDTHGHIVGIALDSSQQFLFVNVRSWPDGAVPTRLNPPPIASDIEMKVLDLKTLRFLDKKYIGQRGFTDTMGAFYIYLDTSETLVCSGSEDKYAYVWDRELGCVLARNGHDDVVNCVAFCPTDPEIMVSVGDDNKIKIWISKQQNRLLNRQNYLAL